MPQHDFFLQDSGRGRSQTSYVPPNPFRQPTTSPSPSPSSLPTATNATPRTGKVSFTPRRHHSHASSGASHLPMTNATLPGPSTGAETDVAASASASSTASTYTGAAILSSYTNRRKMLQKASALSAQMHKRVEDVVQMEEEQRLLSQAYRSRQKLAEQEQEQAQAQQKRQTAAAASTTGNGAAQNSAAQDARHGAGEADGGGDRANGADSDTAGHPVMSSDGDGAGGTSDGYGVVLEGAPDTKRQLQQQAQEKNETLGKMRGMQLAIQELSAEAAAEEERWFARSRFTAEAAPTAAPAGPTNSSSSNGNNGGANPSDREAHRKGSQGTQKDDDNSASSSSNNNNNTNNDGMPPLQRKDVPLDVISKLDAIRDLRLALKDMLDARRPHPADSGSYGTSSSIGSGGGGGGGGRGTSAGINTSGGTTWVEQDAVYHPPPPPQVFSTNALAVTLECVSDAMASMARIADEFCIATTFRARGDRLMLLPHLQSLEKWTAQAELSLETTQRHLRHFHVGETAVLEGGAYEVNSLREQTLLLKESLTAQDQKVKATKEAQTAVLHRLREVRQRCRMWASYLLHLQAEGDDGEHSLESPLFYAFHHPRINRSTASLSTGSNSGGGQRAGRSLDGAVASSATAAAVASPTAATADTSVFGKESGVDGDGTRPTTDAASTTFLAPTGHGAGQQGHVAEHSQTTTAHSSTAHNTVRGGTAKTQPQSAKGSSTVADSDASPPPRPPAPPVTAASASSPQPQASTYLKDFLPTPSPANTATTNVYSTSTAASTNAVLVRDAARPPSPSAMDRMERRIAQSWGNPYVRKRQLRQRAEAAAAAAAAAAVAAEASQQDERDMLSLPSLPSQPHPPSPQFGGISPHAPPTAGFRGSVVHATDVSGSDGAGVGVGGVGASLNAPQRLLRASPEERGRKSQVSITPPRTPSPAFGEASDYASVLQPPPAHHRTSRAFGSVATVVSVATGLGEAELPELADVRTLQLLQSLLRSVPARMSEQQPPPPQQGKSATSAAETPLGVADVAFDDAAREASRRSMQRLIQFLKTQTKQPNPNQLSITQK